MAALTPQEVITDARCFTCQGEKQLQGMIVYLLGQILLASDPMADVSPDAVAAAANCYTCKLSGKNLLGAMVYLLTLIEEAGGGGGGAGCCDYWEDTGPNPSGPPADQTKVVTIHFRDGMPSLTWDPVDLIWR